MSRFLLQGVVFLCVSQKKNNSFLKKGHFFRGKTSSSGGANLRTGGAVAPPLCMLKEALKYKGIILFNW